MQWLGLALAYLIGAIPVGLVIGLARGVDVRRVGSGNIGATNVMRGLGAGFGLLVFVADVLKGVGGVLIGRAFGMQGWLLGMAALFAVLGHSYSPYLAFKGGKGVATSLGAMLAIGPIPALVAFGVWFVTVALTRYVSLGSVLAAAVLPVCFALLGPRQPDLLVPIVILAIIVIGRHNENIGRLLAGEESRFGAPKASAREAPGEQEPARDDPAPQ
ncbi:MAG: glycerol-3-phosphate 1-O-acyltransferase PlsY [Armatimonadota bacterium]